MFRTTAPAEPIRRSSDAPARTTAIGAVLYAAWALWAPLDAFAGGGGGGHGEAAASDTSLGAVLGLVLLVGAAYMLAHFVVDNLQKRFLLVSGVEYMLLGALLGPHLVADLIVLDNAIALRPVMAFAAGWVGLLYGMELELRAFLDQNADSRALRIAVSDTLISMTAVGGGAYVFFTSGWLMEASSPTDAGVAAALLGCAAAAGSSSAVDLLASKYDKLQTQLLPILRRTARLGDLFAIATSGIVFAIFHVGETHTANPPAVSDWILLTVGLGVGLGLLFAVFLGDDRDENQIFLALVGIIVFAAGASFFLNLSALTVNLLLGAVLANTAHCVGVRDTLQTSLKPATLVLLVFAGALWTPVAVGPALVVGACYICVRAIAKALGCWAASLGTALRADIFRGLMAQGEATLAIALSFRLVYDGAAMDLAYTAVLTSVVLNELIAPRLLKDLLVDAGELRSDHAFTETV